MINISIIAEVGFDPTTSGLWAQHASTAPLCFIDYIIGYILLFFLAGFRSPVPYQYGRTGTPVMESNHQLRF